MSLVEETAWPPTEVIVSPAVRPALAAAEPDRAPAMVTPLLVPLPLVPLPSPWLPNPPKPLPSPNPPNPPESPEPLPELLPPVSMPRKAVAPMWMTEDALPAYRLRYAWFLGPAALLFATDMLLGRRRKPAPP